jgi:hypothetical protein
MGSQLILWTSEPLPHAQRQLCAIEGRVGNPRIGPSGCTLQILDSGDTVVHEEVSRAFRLTHGTVISAGLEFCAKARPGHRIRILYKDATSVRGDTLTYETKLEFIELRVAGGTDSQQFRDVLALHGPHFEMAAGHGYDPPMLYFDGGVVPNDIVAAVARIAWKDQGWGNRKGHVWLRVMREKELVREVTLFGPAAHEPEVLTLVLDRTALADICPGDSLEFWRLIGGGGGHSLRIYTFSFELLLQPNMYQRGLLELLGERRFCDITLTSTDRTCVPAHRAVLTARSPVLRSMILDQCSEADGELRLELNAQTLKDVPAFIYTGQCDRLTLRSNLTAMTDAAHMLALEDLQLECRYVQSPAAGEP